MTAIICIYTYTFRIYHEYYHNICMILIINIQDHGDTLLQSPILIYKDTHLVYINNTLIAILI